MRLKRVEFELEVPEVPEGHGFVCGAGGQDELGVGVEAQAVDLGRVRVHGVRGLQGEERERVNVLVVESDRTKHFKCYFLYHDDQAWKSQ